MIVQYSAESQIGCVHPQDLEGALMRHCVGSYAEQVRQGGLQIYSLRDPQNHPKVTLAPTVNLDEDLTKKSKHGERPLRGQRLRLVVL